MNTTYTAFIWRLRRPHTKVLGFVNDIFVAFLLFLHHSNFLISSRVFAQSLQTNKGCVSFLLISADLPFMFTINMPRPFRGGRTF